MIPSLRNVSFATHMILPQNVSNKYALVGRVRIEDRFEFVSHLLHYRSPDLNYEFATFSEVSVLQGKSGSPVPRRSSWPVATVFDLKTSEIKDYFAEKK